MLAVEPRKQRKAPVGSPLPRIAPPTPAKADTKAFARTASELGLELFPWQVTASRYLVAENARKHPLYREVAIIVARQNGKTRLLLPLIFARLVAGQRIMHAAQNLRLPGEFHRELAELFETKYPELLPAKRGISWRAGQESIRLRTGGFYQIVAATGGAPRGPANQTVIIDELREMTDGRFLAGIKPTTVAQPDGQIVYLSNAGSEESEVLNTLKARATGDPTLAYLEWSSPPVLATDDVTGWLAANPAIGHIDGMLENLAAEHQAALLGGTMATFETEHLCRWVVSMQERLVTDQQWAEQAELGEVAPPLRSVMAVSMDISGERASAVIAWRDVDGTICLDVHDTKGAPIDITLLGPDLLKLAQVNRARDIAFDPYTDADLVRYLPRARGINGREYASASEKFVRLVSERKFRIHDPQGILAADLAWTTRRSGAFSSYMAVRASEEHTNTAVLAAVRAAWLASAPVSDTPARIH